MGKIKAAMLTGYNNSIFRGLCANGLLPTNRAISLLEPYRSGRLSRGSTDLISPTIIHHMPPNPFFRSNTNRFHSKPNPPMHPHDAPYWHKPISRLGVRYKLGGEHPR